MVLQNMLNSTNTDAYCDSSYIRCFSLCQYVRLMNMNSVKGSVPISTVFRLNYVVNGKAFYAVSSERVQH